MDIIKNEGVFRLFDRQTTLILTNEKQLDRIIADPAAPLFVDEELGFSHESKKLNGAEEETLVSKCRDAQAAGCTRMEVSYDFFFGGSARHNYPSDETTIKAFKVIRDTARAHGMAFGASILSPLDVGGGWAKQSDETGFSCQFQETAIAPDGSYRADMVCQRQWYNNKGPIALTPYKTLVFAFNEQRVGETSCFYVDENAILDISDTAKTVIEEEKTTVTGVGYGYCPMHIAGCWQDPTADRALCVMVYRTPELDYFADSAPAFMQRLLDAHNAAGIDYQGFYSDEMHIQFDWDLDTHFGASELDVRYLTPHLAAAYADRYGEKYRDFAKYLVYMSYRQHDFLPGEAAGECVQHVFAPTAQGIYDTWLFRNRYFELLQRRVVDLACEAKAYAEGLWGAPIMTRAHATWQESPTCDHFYASDPAHGGLDLQALLGSEYADVNKNSPPERRAARDRARADKLRELGISRYEYTPWFDWSSSIRENISACYDYFKWNEFLSGGGTDHAECGSLDRTYFGQALAASFGELNPFGLAYCAGWGMPDKIHRMLDRMANAYGNAPWNADELHFVNGLGTRRTDVLALYPLKLNIAEERFGTWMVQYAYCNYITEEKLLQTASVADDGTLVVNGQHFRCLVALFEPFLQQKTFDLLEEFLQKGGRVLWMSAPALVDAEGNDTARRFGELFGLREVADICRARRCKNGRAVFTGALAGVPEMEILTDFVVDAVYPCEAADGEAVASVGGQTAGVLRRWPGGGLALYAGFRLRDDQSCSLGADVDTLFRVLCAIGAYRADSLEVKSRRTGAAYVYNRFADGSVACAPHYREIYEAWEGPFFRDQAYDAAALAGRALPDGRVHLNEALDGHAICYEGDEFLAYRLDADGAPVAFFGIDSAGITVDSQSYVFADRPVKMQFAPVPKKHLADGVRAALLLTVWSADAEIAVPAAETAAEAGAAAAADGTPQLLACRDRIFDAADAVPHTWDGRTLRLRMTPALSGRAMVLVFGEPAK